MRRLRAGIKTVVIPEENVKDLAEIGDEVKAHLEIRRLRGWTDASEDALQRCRPRLSEEGGGTTRGGRRRGKARASPRIMAGAAAL